MGEMLWQFPLDLGASECSLRLSRSLSPNRNAGLPRYLDNGMDSKLLLAVSRSRVPRSTGNAFVYSIRRGLFVEMEVAVGHSRVARSMELLERHGRLVCNL